jgi:hypothetical protein
MFAAVCALALVAALAIFQALQGSNCGGNSAALHDVRWYALLVQLAAEENPGRQFSIAEATPRERDELERIADDFWIPGARFWVSPLPQRIDAGQPPRLIIVCDREFRNVPRQLIGSAPPTHAAAFSDGSSRLISTEEFAAIDRSSLLPLDELLARTCPDQKEQPTAAD